MLKADPPCTYFELTGYEFVSMLGAARPVLCPGWREVRALPAGTVRAVRSALLPWGARGQVTDVCAWPDGSCMVSPAMWLALGGTSGE
jgi:hypothetical protein